MVSPRRPVGAPEPGDAGVSRQGCCVAGPNLGCRRDDQPSTCTSMRVLAARIWGQGVGRVSGRECGHRRRCRRSDRGRRAGSGRCRPVGSRSGSTMPWARANTARVAAVRGHFGPFCRRAGRPGRGRWSTSSRDTRRSGGSGGRCDWPRQVNALASSRPRSRGSSSWISPSTITCARGVVDGAVGQRGPHRGTVHDPPLAGMCPSDTRRARRGDGDRRDRGYGPVIAGGPSRGSGRGPPAITAARRAYTRAQIGLRRRPAPTPGLHRRGVPVVGVGPPVPGGAAS